ncbi:MAG: hypothetical protein DMF65_14300 [Acidobacteria bacterium]|nr:MAG: hypothetical protein DMF65_14300 [Acidobacteriota bacterium]
MSKTQIPPELALQVRVSKMLGYGFAFAIVWAGGVGSLIALVVGLRARKLIRQSGGELSGMKMAWVCIIGGVIGLVTILPYVIWLLLTAKR